MANELQGFRVAMLVTGGFEESELVETKKALEAAGAAVKIVSPVTGEVQSARHGNPGDMFRVDALLGQTHAGEYDALVLPGGVASPDRLRIMPAAVAFVKHFVESGKPIAAICHGPWTLIEAGGVRGRRLTSWLSLKTDLVNAGAKWVDQKVVDDRGLVTSRRPDDLPAFVAKTIEVFAASRLAHTGVSRPGNRR
ncbi:MAG: type 1 glutamine amidotransferase [Elusimicrobia bacterium]|nr:type 1 glutamine amidotransferase [Elusimicrobiota bacterium]